MRRLTSLICIFFCLTAIHLGYTQDISDLLDYQERHSLYDYNHLQLKNTDTIPDFNLKDEKLKLTGTIYLSDGVTPAKDVILFIEQPDENGNFDLREDNEKRYVHHRAWVKTDVDGKYTFYTFVPGNDRRYNQLQQIFPVIKEPFKTEYEIDTFLFEDDPLLSKRCRNKITKKSHSSRILSPKKKDGIFVAERNITLNP